MPKESPPHSRYPWAKFVLSPNTIVPHRVPFALARRFQLICNTVLAGLLADEEVSAPLAYHALALIDDFPGIDQRHLATLMGVDRTNVGQIIDDLEMKGMVQRRVSVIATIGSTPAALAAKAATTTIPVVFYSAFDPVEVGLVASFNRPGGNVTGISSLGAEVGPKRLELMHELVPKAKTVALLINPASTGAQTQASELMAAARKLGLQLHVLNASAEGDLEVAFASMVQLRAGVLLLGNDGFFYGRRKHLAALAERHAIPTIFPWRDAAVDGGLITYGGSVEEAHREVGTYSARVLKGDKPADMPVMQVRKFELTVNLKTAKALGIEVPMTVLVRADEVIE